VNGESVSVPPEDRSDGLLAIFDITAKAALTDHCRDLLISKAALANVILACQGGVLPIHHIPVFKHHHPTHLTPTDDELQALARSEVGSLTGKALKFVRKMDETVQQRRLFNGHLFLPAFNPGEWHFFYFDQRDASEANSHWKHGSHIHLMNMVTHPQLRVEELAAKLDQEERPKLGGGLHIRFKG
jgi:hypothetical protein